MLQNEVSRELHGWSTEANTDLPNGCAHQFFEQQVGHSGDAVAVICGDKRLTYVELNGRANQLARHLRELGVGPDTLVAICVTRGVDLAVGILGILKAGGAWVPMDPRHPRERKQTVLESTKAPFLLTESSLLSDLPTSGIQTVVLDAAWAGISTRNPSNLDNIAVPSNLAYVMFTSGSTGRPKGVMVTHANLAQYVVAMREVLMVTPADIYLHTASIAFSSSVRQLFLPLVSGATSLVATVEQLRESLSLFEAIKNQNVTILDLVPSYWRTCIDALSTLDELTCVRLLKNRVRLIATASEALQSDLPRKWRQEFRHSAQLINMFGQTETTGIVTTYTIPADDPLEVRIVPLGKPIANASTYLLDEQGRIVPNGNLGEIHIGGPGVARGYLNLQEATAERFLPNPFSSMSGDRLYKTGDLGRCRADGTIEFVGREDDQVKIRGIRIEPAEVTAVLGEHSDIKECVVIGQTDENKIRRLVAYVVPHEGRTVASGALRTYLGEKLPEYMIPSAFVSLDTLPRLASGKIDRQALPDPNHVRPEARSPMVPPRTAMERQLLDQWRAALGIVSIGILDSFFELGGNSLSAMYLLNHVNKIFGESFSVASLYMAPSVKEFASLIEHQRQPVTTTSLQALHPQGFLPPFFWIHGEVSNALLPRLLGPEQPVYGLGHQSLDGVPAKFTSVETIAAHYLEEMRTVQHQGPYYIGGYCFGGLIAFEIAHQLKKAGEDVALLAILEPGPLRTCGPAQSDMVTDNRGYTETPGERVSRHINKLKTLGMVHAVNYVSERVWGAIIDWTRPASTFTKKVVCGLCLRYGLTLPVLVRSFHILGVYRRARKDYEVQAYPGRITLFARELPYVSPSTWDGFATDGVQIHQVTGGTHTSILEQPHLEDWAEKLKKSLKVAREQASSPSRSR